MSSNFLALIYYPGVIGKTSVDYAHPVLVNMAEVGLNPYAQPANISGQGTSFHFPVPGNNPGNAIGEHSETHWHRAWRTWAWRSVRIQGSLLIATETGREDNATAYTPAIPFDFILTESDIPDKEMTASCSIAGAGTYPIASVAHLGDASGGALVTNANMKGPYGSLGEWRFAELSDSPAVKYTTTVTTVTAYGTGPSPGPDIPIEVVCDLSVSAYGNSSVLRYVDEDGNWQWVSIFYLGISAALRFDSDPPSGYVIEGPDGSRNPDVSPLLNTSPVFCSTDLSAIGEDTTTASMVGDVNLSSTESLSPDPEIYQSTETMTIDVPWLETGGTPITAQRGVWSGLSVEFADPLYAVRPDLFP